MEVEGENGSELQVLGGRKKMRKQYAVNCGEMKLRYESCATRPRRYSTFLFGTVENANVEMNVSGVKGQGDGSGTNCQGSRSGTNSLFYNERR